MYNSDQCFGWIRWIRKILASWIRISKNIGTTDPDPKGKISTKNCQKKFTLKTQIWTIEKRDFKNFLISECLIKFCIKIWQKIWKFYFDKKKSVLKDITLIQIHFFQCRSRIRIHIKIKWILSTAFKGTIINWALPFLYGGSLLITL